MNRVERQADKEKDGWHALLNNGLIGEVHCNLQCTIWTTKGFMWNPIQIHQYKIDSH